MLVDAGDVEPIVGMLLDPPSVMPMKTQRATLDAARDVAGYGQLLFHSWG